ncbi:MAG: metallophosphoesterase family protein [Saprospiraceae bacterium]|nr:metallophosphoesterase family protein [Saprospiraceae bacterium]
MRILIYICLCIIAFTSVSNARTDRFRCIIRDNPATSMVIGWNQVSGSNPIVYYDTKDHGQSISNYGYSAYPQRTIHAKGMHNHYVRLNGLKPNTVYYFVVQDDDGTSSRYWFQTLPDDHNERLSIVAGGDSRNYRIGRQNANRMVARLRPHFVMFAGDMTGGDTEREWKEWMLDWQLTIPKDGRITPIVPARGNHEFSNRSIIDMFDVKTPDIYYGLTFARGLLRVYTLNSMMPSSGAQKEWLANDLKENQDIAWRFAQYHHPMRPHTRRKSEHEYLRRYWGPLFHQYKVQLALECDSHMAKVTWPIRASNDKESDEGFVRDDANGTVFIGEGGWGAPLRDADDSKSWTRAIGSFNQVKWIIVGLSKIEIRTLPTDNVQDIGYLTDNNRYNKPAGLTMWKIGGQEKVDLFNRNVNAFAPQERASLMEINSALAETTEESVELKWETIYEEEFTKFRVQSSTDRVFWKTLATLKGQGESEDKAQYYNHIDKSINRGGKIYYRIVAIDVLGRERVQASIEIRSVGNELMETLQTTLSSGRLIVPVVMPYDEQITIDILDINRRLVFRRALDLPKGQHRLPLNVKHLPVGSYLLELNYRNKIFKKNVKVAIPGGD